jgi:hypothetical protein
MSAGSARVAMKVIGAGRLAIGLGLLARPTLTTRGWLGDAAESDGAQVAVRGLGARDALLGFMALHVAGSDDPMVAARWSAAIALCDLTDGVATLAARRSGRLGPQADAVVALGLGSAVAGLAVAGALQSARG